MSFFNPIRSQFRRLEKVFRDDPALDLRYAAGLMHVAPEKVAHSIQIMIERQYFTPDVPVVDNRLSVLIRDQRYLELATLKRKTQKLQQSLQTAGSASERVMQVPGYNNVGRSQVFGSFVRDILDSALASPTPGSAIRSRAGSCKRGAGPGRRRPRPAPDHPLLAAGCARRPRAGSRDRGVRSRVRS